MKNVKLSKGLVKIVLAVLGLVIIVVWASGAMYSKTAAGVVDSEPGRAIPENVRMIRVQVERVPTRILLPGTARSEQNINISARLSAYVDEVLVSAGSAVSNGMVMLRLDKRELQKELAGAEAALAQAEAAFEREKRLLATEATTPQRYEAAESAYKSALAQVERAKVMTSYAEIQAPIDGIVTDRFVEEGDLAVPGQVLLTVFDPTQMRLDVPVPARLVSQFPIGSSHRVIMDQIDKPLRGEVTEVVSAFDPATRTRTVKMKLDSGEADVLPGMYGKVLLKSVMHDAVMIPAECVTRIGQLEYVDVVEGDRLIRRLIKTGADHDDRLEVLAGLDGREQLACSNE